jgi:hypothetical protein
LAIFALLALLAGGLPTVVLAQAESRAQSAQVTAPTGGKLPVPDTPGGGLTNPSERLPGERLPTEIDPPPPPAERIPEQIEPPISRPGQGAEKQLPASPAPDRERPDPGESRVPAR